MRRHWVGATMIALALVACHVCLAQDVPSVRSVRLQADRIDRRVVEAAKAGDKAAIIRLLQQKADVNVPEPDGTTALSWAVRQGDIEIADRLIKAGADVKAGNRYGVTPLYLAALNGDAAIIEKLLKAGADVNGQKSRVPVGLVNSRLSHDPPDRALVLHPGHSRDTCLLQR